MIWIILGIIVVLVLIVVGVYNGLVKSRMQTREAWSQIDVQLKRRNDLIPNLIETVKGYAKYEGDTLAKVTQLRQQVAQASSPAEAMAASDALSRQVAGIFAVAERAAVRTGRFCFRQMDGSQTRIVPESVPESCRFA